MKLKEGAQRFWQRYTNIRTPLPSCPYKDNCLSTLFFDTQTYFIGSKTYSLKYTSFPLNTNQLMSLPFSLLNSDQ